MTDEQRYTAEDLERAAWQARTDTTLASIATRLDTTATAITELAARKDESHNAIYQRIADESRQQDDQVKVLRTEIHEVRNEVGGVRTVVAELIGKLKLGGAALVVGASSLTAILTRLIG